MMPILINLEGRPASGFAEPIGLLQDCHRRIEWFLSELRRVSSQWHGAQPDDADRRTLESCLHYFTIGAPRHVADEEESLFPRLRGRSDAAAQALVSLQRLESDHLQADAWHHEANDLVRRWLTDGRLDAAAADRLATLLEQLTSLYAAHITVEDNEVFPAAAAALDAAELTAIGREMALRRGLDPAQALSRG